MFCLSFIFLNSLIGRDFGPMLNAERRARNGEPVSEESKKYDEENPEAELAEGDWKLVDLPKVE